MQTIWGNTPATYENYHDLLANKSIDAVFIMTPEHLHHDMAIAALRAGKHVYLEKPLAHTIEEGFDIVREWKKSGKIVQVGTQNRSSSLYKKAKEMVQQGMIGDVHFVRAFWYRNSTDDNPAWRYAIPPDATEQNTDWAKFLGPAPKRAWDPHRYYQWRLYWDYSGGISTDLLVHQTDIVNFMLDRNRAAPRAWRRAGFTAGPGRMTIATRRILSARFTNIPASCRSTIRAISATTITATASSYAAMRAPSKC